MIVKKNVSIGLAVALLVACTTINDSSQRRARQYPPARPVVPAVSPVAVHSLAVPARLSVREARIGARSKQAQANLVVMDGPQTKRRKRNRYAWDPDWQAHQKQKTSAGVPVIEGLSGSVESTNFDDNGDTTNGFFFIPADPHGAAGPAHLVSVTNTSIWFHLRNNPNSTDPESLFDFFSVLSPLTYTFDPRTIYDARENRWLVLALERTDTAEGDAANSSRILLAVSDDDDPNGDWTMTAINAMESIGGGDHWADYPTLVVDEEVVYITANMFRFFDQVDPGAFGGTRLWVVDKGVVNGFYDDRSADVARYDPFSTPGVFAGTHQPARILGTPPPGDVGTYLVMFDGLVDGNDETVQIVEIDDPLGSTEFNFAFLSLDNIDNLAAPLPDMPQRGPSIADSNPLEANDRRTLDAVWRDARLYFTTTIEPRSGPGRDETTALWAAVDTAGFPNVDLDQLGILDGDDIANETFTGYAALTVSATGVVTIGFAASGERIFPGAYYAVHVPGDPSGSTRGSLILREGEDHYVRTFGGPENRWGDYSSVVLDPSDDVCFWVYNQYAMNIGTELPGLPEEDGRWGTAFGQVCANRAPMAVGEIVPDVMEDVPSTIAFSVLTANDDSGDSGQQLSVTAVQNALGGSAVLQGGAVRFTPTADFFGAGSFDYVVSDNGTTGGGPDPLQDTATATFAITPINDIPQLVDDILPPVMENAPTVIIPTMQLLSNDMPGPANESTQSLSVSGVSAAVGGSVLLNGAQVEFSLAPGFDGTARFVYTAGDDGAPPLAADANARFSVSGTNDPPVAGIETVTVYRGRTTVVLDSGSGSLLANDSDPELSALSAIVTIPPADGLLTIHSSGGFNYRHNGSANPTDSFTYQVCDTGSPVACDSAVVNIAVVAAPFALCAPAGVRAVVGIPFGVATASAFDPAQTSFGVNGLPVSLQIDSATGAIFGVPTLVDVGRRRLTVTASGGAPTETLALTITIDADTDSAFFSGLEDTCLNP